MSFLRRWIDSHPKESDEPPVLEGIELTVDADDFDDLDEISIVQEETEDNTIADILCAIEYCASNGEKTRRRVTMRKLVSSGEHPSVYAYSHERKAIRQFRLDRIECIITADGEILGSGPIDFGLIC